MKNIVPLLAILLCLMAATISGAPLDASLISSIQTAQPGQTVAFTASLLNSGVDQEFLNGINTTLAGPLVVDDSPFFLAPALLAPGESYVGPILNVIVPSTTPVGIYAGRMDILGGPTANSFETLSSLEFGVNVVPEPSTLMLLAPALAGLAFVRPRSKRGQNGLGGRR